MSLPFFLADNGDGLAAEAAETGLDRFVLGKLAVAGERGEVFEEFGSVVEEMRALRMARDLRLLPGGQLGVDVGHRLAGAHFQPADLIRRVDALIFLGKLAKLVDLAFEIRDGLFEIEVIVHEMRFRSFAQTAPLCSRPSGQSHEEGS